MTSLWWCLQWHIIDFVSVRDVGMLRMDEHYGNAYGWFVSALMTFHYRFVRMLTEEVVFGEVWTFPKLWSLRPGIPAQSTKSTKLSLQACLLESEVTRTMLNWVTHSWMKTDDMICYDRYDDDERNQNDHNENLWQGWCAWCLGRREVFGCLGERKQQWWCCHWTPRPASSHSPLSLGQL